MANKQSKVDSLEEPISKLVAENDILRRENTEIKSENIKLKTENAKLKQALKEHESRFMKLEQNDKDTASENAKLKARVAKLEQKQLQTDKEKSNILYYEELSSQYSTSPVCTENKSLKDKEIDEFVDSIYEEQVSKEIIQRIREKKLREQELSSISVEELCSEKVRLKVPLEQNSKSVPIQPEETKVSYDYIVAHPSRNQAQKESIEVIKNKEPDISDHNENDKHIVIELAHLYQKARKAKKNTIYAKQEEILSWYYYAEGFERRVNNNLSICRNNNRADDLARIQVYDKIWDCLSGVSRENFRKQTQRACKIYKLFNGIGKDRIKRVKSYSANEISKLSNSQIQYIIQHFTKESRNKQYPDLYREGSNGNDITDESLCPLCKLDHDDNETGHEPWQLPKAVISTPPKPKTSDFKPITYEAKPDPELIKLIIKSVLEHFTYLKFRNSFRGIDNYNFASAQPWSSPCPICDGKHGNYGLHGEWYKNETEYCLTCNTKQ
ncbi:hypothetical protein C2G38_2192054 [Gigaspora rosea]|uniref:Uncharacterized protein n=1 Tax=Gigaspora rosea TaxID=44941 RepID=A0A397V2F9_9GLOM|nr:hypothetical protein C2G38_2192054 [Gigaspora rosea]